MRLLMSLNAKVMLFFVIFALYLQNAFLFVMYNGKKAVLCGVVQFKVH